MDGESINTTETPMMFDPSSLGILEAVQGYSDNAQNEYDAAFSKSPQRKHRSNLALAGGVTGVTAAAATGLMYGQDPANQAYTKAAMPAFGIEMWEQLLNPKPKPALAIVNTANRFNLINLPEEGQKAIATGLTSLYDPDSKNTDSSGLAKLVQGPHSLTRNVTELMKNPQDTTYGNTMQKTIEFVNKFTGQDQQINPEKLSQSEIESINQTLFGTAKLPDNAYINTLEKAGDLGVRAARQLSIARALRNIPKAMGWDEGVKYADKISYFLYSNPILFLGGLGVGALYTGYKLNRFLRNRESRKAEKFFDSRLAAFSNNAQMIAA